MEQQENSKIEKGKFILPKEPTMAGSITIAFLLSAILFGFAGYSVAKKYTPTCPPVTKCSVCKKCEECICPECKVEIAQVNEKLTYKYSLNTKTVEYEPDTTKYAGFQICDSSISSCTIYGVEYSKIAKAVLGSKFLLEFNDSNIEDCRAAAGTTYCTLSGEFHLEPM